MDKICFLLVDTGNARSKSTPFAVDEIKVGMSNLHVPVSENE